MKGLNRKFLVQSFLLTLLLLFSSVFCFFKLGEAPLERWDEYIYYNVIEETRESGQFMTLIYEGKPFFEKPPLWIWITMIPVKLFGFNLFSLRFVSAVSGVLSIFLTFLLGKKLFSYKTGILAGFILLGTRHLFLNNEIIFSTHNFRSADLDSLQIFFILLTTLFFVQYYKNKYKVSKWFILSAVSTSLAFLTKGPMAFIPGFVFFTYIFLNRSKIEIDVKRIIKLLTFYLAVIFILILPWHILMLFRYKEIFLTEYISYHIFSRAIIPLEGHNEPWYFYFYLLFRSDFFFSGVILTLSISYLIIKLGKKIISKFPIYLIISMASIILLIITIMGTKLSWYILPVYPFLALILAAAYLKITTVGNKNLQILFKSAFFLILCVQVALNFYLILQ